MPPDNALDELTEAIWPSIEAAIARHGAQATGEALAAILGRVLASKRREPTDGKGFKRPG